MSDADLREIERELDQDPENTVLLERFVSLISRSGGFALGLAGDEDRERVSGRLARLAGDRTAQLETALRAFSIPFKRVRLVEGRSEWQFKLRSFFLESSRRFLLGSDFTYMDCAARVSDEYRPGAASLDLAIHGDARDCVFGGVSTRRLVDFLANPRTVPMVVGQDPAAAFRTWRSWEVYRFHWTLSMLLGEAEGISSHNGHDEQQDDEADAQGARAASWQTVSMKHRGLDFQCNWVYSGCYGSFRMDTEPLDPRVVNASCSTVIHNRDRTLGAGSSSPGDLRCADTGEAQFWTARDLVDAADVFAKIWSNDDERVSADAFMRDLSTLGFSLGEEDVYAWFTRDRYDGHRFKCGYQTPDRTRLELEFLEMPSGKVQAKLWAERDDSEPTGAAVRTPRELFEMLRGMFLGSERMVE